MKLFITDSIKPNNRGVIVLSTKLFIYTAILFVSGCVTNKTTRNIPVQQKPVEKKVSWVTEKKNRSSTDFMFDWIINPRFGLSEAAYAHTSNLIVNMTSKEIEKQIKHECLYLTSSLSSMYNIFNIYNAGQIDYEQAMERIVGTIVNNKHKVIYSSPVVYETKTYYSLSQIAMSLSKGNHKDVPQKISSFKTKCEKEIGYVKYESFLKHKKYGTNY